MTGTGRFVRLLHGGGSFVVEVTLKISDTPKTPFAGPGTTKQKSRVATITVWLKGVLLDACKFCSHDSRGHSPLLTTTMDSPPK